MSGAATRDAGAAVSPNAWNLSTVLPDALPHFTTFAASSRVGMLITHSFVAFRFSKERLGAAMTQPTRGGSNSIIVCHDCVITSGRPLREVVIIATGPGSRSP